MFCVLCRHLMSYDGDQTYRCTKTNFHKDRNVVVTTGLTRFKGDILRRDDDVEKAHVLLILKHIENGTHKIIKDSEITVHNARILV